MSYPPPINRQQLGIPQLPPRIPPPQFAGFAPTVPPGNNEKDDEYRGHLHRQCSSLAVSSLGFSAVECVSCGNNVVKTRLIWIDRFAS